MENQIIELLKERIAELQAENKDLRAIIERFASRETNIVVNSYNGSNAEAHHTSKDSHSTKDSHTSSQGGVNIENK